MQVRLSHLNEGPHLETSTPIHDPAHPQKMLDLQDYAVALYAKLVEYAMDSYQPTQEGAYRDLFTSTRTPEGYVQGTLSPEQTANQSWNLLIKIREHQGSFVLVVAPTATAQDRLLLRAATQDIRSARGAPSAPTAIVYHWLSVPAPGEAQRAHVELSA